MRILTRLCPILVLGLLAGCDLELMTMHEPMHPVSEPAHLRATATGYVDKIEIWVEIAEMTGYAPNRASIDNVIVEEYLARTCNPAGFRRHLTCYKTLGKSALPAHSLVTYRAVARGLFGRTIVETYQFAAGDYLFSGYPIPVRRVTTDLEKTLDIVLIRDPDTPAGFFRWYLDNVIEGGFFDYETYRESRQYYNFYYSGETGTYTDANNVCQFSAPNDAELMVIGDLLLFLHTANMSDCTVQTNFSGELWFEKSIVHEAAHAVFALRDEYAVANPLASPPQLTGPPNLWVDKTSCELAAPGLGLDPSDCKPRSTAPNSGWIIDPVGPYGCLMHRANTQWLKHSDYGPACDARIAWRYDQCAAGTCNPDEL